MRRFVDGISMKSAGFISCGIQMAGLVWTDFRNGIGAELTPRSQNHLGRKRWHWSHEIWDLSCHSNRGMGVSHKWSWIWGFLIWILTRNRKNNCFQSAGETLFGHIQISSPAANFIFTSIGRSITYILANDGLPRWFSGKESTCQYRRCSWEDPLEKGMATCSSILPWEIPWTKEPVGYRPWGRTESDTTGHTCMFS